LRTGPYEPHRMPPASGPPAWLVVGLAVGVAFSLLAAVAFLLGTQLFPAPETDRRSGATADDRRREEVRGYLRYIGEEFVEDHPTDGGTVAFYLPERGVAVTFDARAYFRLEGTDVYPVLLEHELPGAALGSRLPFETPPVGGTSTAGTTGGRGASAGVSGRGGVGGPSGPGGPAAGPRDRTRADRDRAAAAFETLGLAPTASQADVRSAYRERLKTVHPDQGGDVEEFRRLREAYAVAKEAAS